MPPEFEKMAVTCCLAFNKGFDQKETWKMEVFYSTIFFFICVCA